MAACILHISSPTRRSARSVTLKGRPLRGIRSMIDTMAAPITLLSVEAARIAICQSLTGPASDNCVRKMVRSAVPMPARARTATGLV